MTADRILIIHPDPQIGELVDRTLQSAGYEITYVKDWNTARSMIEYRSLDLIIQSDQIKNGKGVDLGKKLLLEHPSIPIILLTNNGAEKSAVDILRQGFADCLPLPVRSASLLKSVRKALERHNRLEGWARRYVNDTTRSLEQRLIGLEALQKVGRAVNVSLDLDKVLSTVVDSAVELTGAEEGSLLLLDESTGELYMRAARNFQEEFVRTFRLPIDDTVPGEALRSGKPVLIDANPPQKIKTSYLVYHLMYVPMQVQDRVIGVLGVDNRRSGSPFNEYHLNLVSVLADYAAIAIENARLYASSETERNKLETILTQIKDGVIVVDKDERLMLVNDTAREAFDLGDDGQVGKPADVAIQNADLLEILGKADLSPSGRYEISLEDGRILNAHTAKIPGVGFAVTMQDITHLKELDRIKTDFVNTVSHDLRSPLTAILGYIELIERVGPVNERQLEFIRRVELSVNNITSLINDLLDLGRIEAGFDDRNEVVPTSAIIRYTVDSLRGRVEDKSQTLAVEVPNDLPNVLGNPVQLRQMLSNLVGNAIKYTPEGGKIQIQAGVEEDQIIFRVKDTGPGIPAGDQPYIFDRFYRGSNIPAESPGTGLGLAIVKTIIEQHDGRIWVDSAPGQGATFTTVLPITTRTA